MPCNTPKLIQLCGNIIAEPAETSAAQPATCSQRRQKRCQLWPASSATACPRPAHSRKSDTMPVRCRVQKGSFRKCCGGVNSP